MSIAIKQKVSGEWHAKISSTCSSKEAKEDCSTFNQGKGALIQLQGVYYSNVWSLKELLNAWLGKEKCQYLVRTQPSGQLFKMNLVPVGNWKLKHELRQRD